MGVGEGRGLSAEYSSNSACRKTIQSVAQQPPPPPSPTSTHPEPLLTLYLRIRLSTTHNILLRLTYAHFQNQSRISGSVHLPYGTMPS